MVSDDTQDDDSDDARPTDTHKHHDRDVAAVDRSDREDKKSDDEDVKKDVRKHAKKVRHADPEKSDDETPKKKSDDETPKKSDDETPKKTDDEDTHKAKSKKPVKRGTKRKHADTKTAPKTEPREAAPADEIEMDDAPPATGSRDAVAEPPATGEGAENEASAAVAAPMPAPPTTTSPLAINDRSLIVRHGGLEVHGGLRTAVLTLPGLMPGTTTSTTSEGLALGAGYGIGEKVEIGADYVVSLSPGSIKGPLTLHGAYAVLVRPKLDVAIAGALAVDFLDSTDPTTMKTTTTTAVGLQLGGWVRYRVAPKVALFTGLPALPASTASLSKLSFALPPLPYQVAVGLSSGSAIAIDLPAGVGFQATPNIYAFAMLDLAHLRISNTQNAFLFANFIPVTVGGFYSRDKLDLGAMLADDLKQGTSYLNFELVARYAL